ncbi:acetyltransferase [Fimicolochytrium jonesii]|uniref:acetyltransferase n=1 Tax=Fimicolochytrium jonesii TaxID=1396493 RepID=UPI0022FDD99B|nr:acetyltransferase [Fimicolochytrium jonesii]KAI8825988.1 acetyltransferase [Fimicolochytrium jonesii]
MSSMDALLPARISPRITIRHFQPGDEPRLLQIANNPNIARNLTTMFPHPYTLADAEFWVAANRLKTSPEDTGPAVPRQRHFSYAVEIDGQLGGAGGFTLLGDYRARTAEIGYWLGEEYWGQGIATAVAAWVVESVRATQGDVVRVEAAVFEGNEGSRRVLEKCGFVREGIQRAAGYRKERGVFDVWMMALVWDDRVEAERTEARE